MSDQNQWPKPGETPGESTPGGTPADQHAPSSAAQPDVGQPQQYGASAPEAPAASNDPWGQPGQGQQNPYAAPSQQNPYAAPSQQNPYAAPGQQGGQPGHGAPQNPYAAPSQQNPYNPYAAPSQGQYNPYAAPSQGQQNPYAAPGPYAAAGYQPYAQRPKTNTLAILSIVFGLGAIPLWFMAILLGPAGAILGHVALGKIKQSGEGGRGLALTGIIAGWVMTGVWILWIIGIAVFAGIGSSYSDNYGYDSGAFIG